MRLRGKAVYAGLGIACALWGKNAAMACGISWAKPGSYFENVDAAGHLFHVEKVGDLTDAGKLSLPVYLIFDTSYAQVSPYLGRGWEIPLLESKFFPVDQNDFKLRQPDGWVRYFWRDGRNKNLLHGQGNWRGEINGSRVVLWADCGSRLTFTNGRITQIVFNGHELNYVYAEGKVSEIRQNGVTLLTVERDSRGEMAKIRLGAKHVDFSLGDKPWVENISGLNVIGKLERSLRQMVNADGVVRNFDFSVDEKINPMLKINSAEELVWSAATQKILRDGSWTYQIEGPQITRSNPENLVESWIDRGGGFIETKNAVGFEKRLSFTSGPARGAMRSRTLKDGFGLLESRYAYDEQGRTLRISETLNGNRIGITNFAYPQTGTTEITSASGRKVSVQKTADGTLIEVDNPALGQNFAYTITSNGLSIQNPKNK